MKKERVLDLRCEYSKDWKHLYDLIIKDDYGKLLVNEGIVKCAKELNCNYHCRVMDDEYFGGCELVRKYLADIHNYNVDLECSFATITDDNILLLEFYNKR